MVQINTHTHTLIFECGIPKNTKAKLTTCDNVIRVLREKLLIAASTAECPLDDYNVLKSANCL